MNKVKSQWARWEASSDFQHRVQESIERHRRNRTVGPIEYLAQRRSDLVRELDGKKIIYLDTKHWVHLCHIVVQSPKRIPLYDEILGLLELLRQKGRICCPVSSSLFEELMKQNDISTRRATARVMDYLSGGVCLQHWLDLAKAEFGRHICRTFGIRSLDHVPRLLEVVPDWLRQVSEETMESTFPTWTKVGYWAGEDTFEFSELGAEGSEVMEKVYVDLRWEMTCEQYQAMPDWTPIPDELSLAAVTEREQAKASQVEGKQRFADLLRDNRMGLLSVLKNTLLPMFALCRGIHGSADEHVAAAYDPIYEGRSPQALPSIDVVAGLEAAIILDTTRKVQPNDWWDYMHAAQALPYCDALFCDNYMAQKLRNKPLEYQKIYCTEIGSRPEELVAYLKGLT